MFSMLWPLRRADLSSRGVQPSLCALLCVIRTNNDNLQLNDYDKNPTKTQRKKSTQTVISVFNRRVYVSIFKMFLKYTVLKRV